MVDESRFEGRSHVFASQVMIFGARPLPVPGAGHVLCASALLPISLADGSPVPPSGYFDAIRTHAGQGVAPDGMAPLPGAEVLVLGRAAPVDGDEREAELRCGELRLRFLLRPDPERPGESLALGPEAAAWHEEDNPEGRGGPDDRRQPLIVDADRPERPIWLGPTSALHPARARLMGAAARVDAGGWPEDARPEALCESHSAFWTENALNPGDPLRIVGLGDADVELDLPRYRPNLASLRAPDADWVKEHARMHAVVLLPAAGLGAMIWRAAIPLGDDILGENVAALAFALEDTDAPERDADEIGDIAVARWEDPAAALDDRPLLPGNLAALAAPPEMDPDAFAERHAGAVDWAKEETGAAAIKNPYDSEPPAVTQLNEKLDREQNNPTPDMDGIGDIARTAIDDAKRRHKAAGFDAPDLDKLREPEVRGDALATEIERRLDAPWQSPRELTLAENLAAAPPEAGIDAGRTMERIAQGRVAAPAPAFAWPAMTPAEAEEFGAAALQRFQGADPDRYIDISGAVAAAPPGSGTARIDGRSIVGLLAEETVWRDIAFHDCTFGESSFALAKFDRCTFTNCRFEQTNLSSAIFEHVRFNDCAFDDLNLAGTGWIHVALENCVFRQVSLVDWAIRETVFDGGEWDGVDVNDAVMVNVSFHDMELKDVTWSMVHAPYTAFRRVRMYKVWGMAVAWPESAFESVRAETCGFLNNSAFHRSRFVDTRFTDSGFTKALFVGSEFTEHCVFVRCDLSSAVFAQARLPDTRFVECSMAGSIWAAGVDAAGAWFTGCILRGVDFRDTRLLDAVFTDADLEGAALDDRLTLGADFRGTTRGGGE